MFRPVRLQAVSSSLSELPAAREDKQAQQTTRRCGEGAITVWSFLVVPHPPEKPTRPAAPCPVPDGRNPPGSAATAGSSCRSPGTARSQPRCERRRPSRNWPQLPGRFARTRGQAASQSLPEHCARGECLCCESPAMGAVRMGSPGTGGGGSPKREAGSAGSTPVCASNICVGSQSGKTKPTVGKAREMELVGVCTSARCIGEGQPGAAESKIPFCGMAACCWSSAGGCGWCSWGLGA